MDHLGLDLGTTTISAAVLDADTGEVCFARNASEHALIASTTKIMTGLLIAEDCDPDAVVTVPQEAVGIEGSSLYLKEGEQLTVRALLYGLLLHSGNDAAVALALAHSGSVGAFVEAMNGRARELGLRDTHFTNPNGLDAPEHYSTALDLARLTRAALQVPAFAEVVATRQITIEGRSFTNHNRLLWSLDGAIGVKTGYTRAAGRTLVSAVERNGRRLIAVTLCAPDDWQDHACLYDEAFAAFSEREAVKAGACVASVPLLSGGSAELMAGESVTYALRDGETVTVRPLWPRVAFSAGTPGEPAGEGGVFLGTRCIARIPLLWGECTDGGTNSEDPFCARRCLAARSGGADPAGPGHGGRGAVCAWRIGGAGLPDHCGRWRSHPASAGARLSDAL